MRQYQLSVFTEKKSNVSLKDGTIKYARAGTLVIKKRAENTKPKSRGFLIKYSVVPLPYHRLFSCTVPKKFGYISQKSKLNADWLGGAILGAMEGYGDLSGKPEKRLGRYFERHAVEHYYGDHVRAFFVGTAVLVAVAMPIYGNLLPLSNLFGILFVIILVLLAGLTNPHGPTVLVADTCIAAIGILIFEATAISLYASATLPLFVCREAATLLLLFAFYFSVKTLRAMALGKIGTVDRPWEFEEKK